MKHTSKVDDVKLRVNGRETVGIADLKPDGARTDFLLGNRDGLAGRIYPERMRGTATVNEF